MDRPDPDVRPEGVQRALRGVRQLVETLQSSARAVERRTGITNAQLFLLRAIEEHPGLSLGDLAAVARTQQSTASLVVLRLVRSGLVRRERSHEDARRVVLTLTARGRRKLTDAPVPATTRLLHALEAMAPADRRALVRGLRALQAGLGEPGREPGMLFERTGGRPASGRER